jgi:hypothetical protein
MPCEHQRIASTVVIVDDHTDFRAGAAELLEAAGYDAVASCWAVRLKKTAMEVGTKTLAEVVSTAAGTAI